MLVLCIVTTGVILDQASKTVVEARLRQRSAITIVEGFVELRYARNRGAFFSFGAELPDAVRRGFFVSMSLIAAVLIFLLLKESRDDQPGLQVALSLLLAGALGNFIDRVRDGEVVDFLHFHLRDVFHWATFNLADVYIALGLAYLLWHLTREKRSSERTG